MTKNNTWTLLSVLLRSSGNGNRYRYSKDKKERSKIAGTVVGNIVLDLCIAGLGFYMCYAYCFAGLGPELPALCSMGIVVASFLLTLLKTNGYLFAFKGYDMTVSLPFPIKDVVGSRFLYMYVKSLPLNLCISLSILAGYIIWVDFNFFSVVLWIVLTVLLPLIPMVLAALAGALIAAIGSGFKFKKAVQAILLFAFVLLCFGARFFFQDMFQNDQVEQVMTDVASAIDGTLAWCLPAAWFEQAIQGKLGGAIGLILVSVLVYELFVMLVGSRYRQINSRLMASHAGKNYKLRTLKTRSAVRSVAFKEWRAFLSSLNYLVNCGMGQILCFIVSIAVLIFPAEKIISLLAPGVPVDAEIIAVIAPSIPFIVYFFLGMVSTTAVSPSLEGKNLWILKSLPMDVKTIYRGKMLFNLWITLPFMVVGTACLCICAHTTFGQFLLYTFSGLVLCVFSTLWGMVCGIKHVKLQWDNDIEVIKQGSAVAVYLFPNMFGTMIVLFGVIILGVNSTFNSNVVVLCATALYALLAFLCALRVRSFEKKGFDYLQ
ncbi:MAG: hypothetical protein KBT02_00335 [Treponema sp.]|nr:hypothetical protein [Candidatus Treponema caballi]